MFTEIYDEDYCYWCDERIYEHEAKVSGAINLNDVCMHEKCFREFVEDMSTDDLAKELGFDFRKGM